MRVEANFPLSTTNQKHYPDLDNDTSSLWNLGSFLSRHFAGKPVMASRNVGFFLRLSIYKKYYLFTHRPEVGEKYRLFSSLSLAASDTPSRDPLPFNGLGKELIAHL